MLNRADLLRFAQHYDGQKSLSVYIRIPPDAATPATAARALLRHGLARIRDTVLFAPHEERELFEACAARVNERAEATIHRQGAGTWVAFATADGMTHDETIAAALPTCVAWEDRVRIVPYLSASDEHSALVALFDRQHAVISRFANGALTEIEQFETRATGSAGPHTSAPPKQSFHPGTHGEPASEAAARAAEHAFRQHTAHLLKRINALDHAGDWLVLGGPSESVSRLTSWLAPAAAGRLVVIGSVTPASSVAVVRAAVDSAILERHRQLHQRLVADLVGRHPRPAVTAVGRVAVDAALTARAVGKLVFADRWAERFPSDAEELTRQAFAQDALVEVVGNDAGATIETLANGIAARLRFPVSLLPVQLSADSAGATSGMEN